MTIEDLRPGDLLILSSMYEYDNGSAGEFVLSIVEDVERPDYFRVTLFTLWCTLQRTGVPIIHMWTYQHRSIMLYNIDVVRSQDEKSDSR